MKKLVLFATALIALGQPPAPETPKDVLDLIRTSVEALADKDPTAFLDKFDRKMPDFGTLRDEVFALLAHSDVSSEVEIISDQGDAQTRALQLDWVLNVDEDQPRRQIIKCRLERQGKKWKIMSLEPVEFFKPAS